MQYSRCYALQEQHNKKSHEIPIWGERYTKGSYGLKRSQLKDAFVAHTRDKTNKLDIASSLVCAHKKKQVFADVLWQLKPHSHYVGQLQKNNPCGWEFENIELP